MKRLDQSVIRCPAGTLIRETAQGPASRCGITQETLTAEENGNSVRNFCCNKYTNCPVWRKEKDAIAADKARELHREIARVRTPQERPT